MKHFVLFLLLIFFAAYSLKAQQLDSTIENYGSRYGQEKIYLHYDKSSYLAGETIWFKAYMMEGIYPTDASKTLYIDWIADNGNVLYHSVSPIIEGVTNGQFEIPASFKGNIIHVRGYTKWMLNFDSAFFYKKEIHIISKAPAEKSIKQSINPSIEFFPEGGDAIAGIPNKIAFKATDQWGKPVNVKGVITNSAGAISDSFHSVHDGMGYFMLIPEVGAAYIAKWKDDKNNLHTTQLPAVKVDGIAMQVAVTGNKRYIKLSLNNKAAANFRTVHLIGTMNQHVVFKADAGIGSENTIQKIVPVNNLPSGILTITAFDASNNAIAERVTFIDNHDYSFKTSIEVKHWGLNRRARNEVEINLSDKFQGGSLSVSVTDAAIENDTTDNIISHLLLTADIKGKVFNPAWYFSEHGDSSVQFLDLVMLTNGWRRFKWEDVEKGKYPVIKFPRDTSYLALSGKVFGVTRSQLTGNENIVLLIKGGIDTNTRMIFMPVRQDATFGDPSMIFFDSLQVYYHLKSKFFSSAEARFMPDLLPAPNYTTYSKTFTSSGYFDTTGFYHHSLLALEANRLREIEKGRILETVIVKAKTKSPVEILDEKYASGLFRGSDSYNFDLVNDPMSNNYQNIFFYLASKVAGLQIDPTSTPPSAQWRGSTPTFFLDQVQTDVNLLSSIPVSDVAYIKVFRPPFVGAPGGGSGGAISIYTRRGSDVSNSNNGRGLTSNTITGYTPVKQFYSPNYSSFDPKNEAADIRTTIYWNPSIVVSQGKHSATFSFYNNDATKSFRVIIEGMTKDGLLTHHEEIME